METRIETRAWDERYVEGRNLSFFESECLSPAEEAVRWSKDGDMNLRIGHLRGLSKAAEASGIDQSRLMLLPLVEEMAMDQEDEIRHALVEGLGPLAAYFAGQGDQEACEHLLQLACTALADEDLDVQLAAEDAVVKIMTHVERESTKDALVELLLVLANQEESEPRKTGARLMRRTIGELCDGHVKQLEALVLDMAKDEEHEVREDSVWMICSLANFAEPDTFIAKYWSVLQALSSDKVWSVRQQFAECITSIQKHVPCELLVDSILALFVDPSSAVQKAIYTQIGDLVIAWGSKDIPPVVVRTFCTVPLQELVSERGTLQACAVSFPKVASALGGRSWDDLRSLFHYLCCSKYESVRCTAAGFLHELVGVLDHQDLLEHLEPVLHAFLVDTEAVREAALENIVSILEILPQRNTDDIAHLLAGFPTFSDEVTANWRLRLALAKQLGRLANCVSDGNVEHNIVPLALRLWCDPVADVRLTTSRQLGTIMTRILECHSGPAQDVPLVQVVIKYATSESCQKRILFIEACSEMMKSLKGCDTLHLFLPLLLKLADDRVPNVRLAVAIALRKMQLDEGSIIGTSDLEPTIIKLQSDKDQDVVYYAKA